MENNRVLNIFIADGQVFRQEYTFIHPTIRELLDYGVNTNIGTTKVWYPPSQIVKIEYSDV